MLLFSTEESSLTLLVMEVAVEVLSLVALVSNCGTPG